MRTFQLYEKVIQLLERILYWRVKSRLVNLDLKHIDLGQADLDTPVFYVTRYRSLADALVVKHECKAIDLPSPFESFELPPSNARKLHSATSDTNDQSQPKKRFKHQLKLRHRFIPLTQPGLSLANAKAPRYFSRTLQKLILRGIEDPEFDIKFVPVSVFWGRSPRVEGSFWQGLFADGWTVPGAFRKFLMVLFKGRQTHLQFSKPVYLRQLIGEEDQTHVRVTAKAHRVIRNRIRKQREAFIGPDLSHRRILVKSLLEQPRVVNMIQREAQKSKESLAKTQAKAHKYANEIAADYSHAVIKCLYVVLTWIWTKLYNGVEINYGKGLQKLAAEHAIVYVPSHRSHIDYLLLSYVLYGRLDLVPPHIAAGINLNLPIVGPILRRGGAFFMRRSFRDNPLYAAIFTEYIQRVLDRNFAIEYFIEGGRSRTGRQLPPKPGMLSMTLQSYANNHHKSLMFVPVNFCYERLFEGKSYLGELKGQKKRKESLMQFFRSLRRIKDNFGKVHVSFGEPISASQFIADQGYSSPSEIHDLQHYQLKTLSLTLGNEISSRINACASVHPIALLSLVLLATPKRSISEHQLRNQLELYLDMQKQYPYSQRTSITPLNPDHIIAYCEDMEYLGRHPHSLGDIFYLTEKQSQYLSYFKNNVLHVYALASLVALLCKSYPSGLSHAALINQIHHFYRLIRVELFLPSLNAEELNGKIEDTLRFFIENELIRTLESDTSKELLLVPYHRPGRALGQLCLLGNLIKPTLERYAITLLSLEHAGPAYLSAKDLEHLSKTLAERFSTLYQMNSPEYFDSRLFQIIVQHLINEKLVTINSEGMINFNDTLLLAVSELEIILGSDLKQSLLSAY